MPAVKSAKRKYKVPRGTAAQLHRALSLSEFHIGEVIRGKRTPSPTLREELEKIEVQLFSPARPR